jgi:myo-inositol 2-dehydrogenase/D-chiro-inositol 1-dehydrogenase
MIGQVHADGLRKLAEDGEIVAVAAADPSADARDAVQRNCPFGRMSVDALDVISDPAVDAVMITSPTATHLDLVRAVLEVGKPLFSEKPLAPTFGDVKTMCAAVVPGHSSWRSDRAQAGGGALLEHSIHSADIVSWLFGPAVRVYALSRAVFGYDVEDVAAVTVEHESGVVGTILTIFNGVRGREERRFEVFFERGAVEATTDFIVGAAEDGYLVQQPDTEAHRLDLAVMREEHFAALGLGRRDFVFYTYPADRNWLGAVRQGGTAVPGFDDALRAHSLVEAAYRSAATGLAVEIGDDFT